MTVVEVDKWFGVQVVYMSFQRRGAVMDMARLDNMR